MFAVQTLTQGSSVSSGALAGRGLEDQPGGGASCSRQGEGLPAHQVRLRYRLNPLTLSAGTLTHSLGCYFLVPGDGESSSGGK